MENLRDMAIRIAMDADSDPLADIRREMADMQREARRLSREVTGLGSSFNNSYGGMIEESQALNQQVNRQSRVIRSLARDMGTSATRLASQWGDMSEGVRRSLIQNHNNLRQYRRQLRGIEGDMLSLSNQMGHYAGSTNDFMREVQRMGADHKRVTDQMINSNIALRASYVQQAATMLNLSTTSSKINKIYAQSGNALYQVNRPLLAVTDSMERLARQGDPVVVALRQLGPNASMKELQDRINLINTGIMRQQSLLMVAGVAWLGFTAILANAAMGPDVEKNLAAQAQAWADYKQALAQRTQEIYSTFSLFERVQIQKTSPRRLYLNLQEQLKVMKGWQTNLHSLAKKGVDEGLIAELRKMGPSAAGEIAALNRMSDKGLNEYVAMWKEKHSLARTAATTELEKLKQQTAAKVQRLKDSLKPLGVAVYEFQNTWADALAPFIDFWGQLASYVVKAGTKVGEFVQKLNEISPWITKLAGMFTYLSLTMLVILTPMAIGIGYIQGMRVAFTAAWTVIKPFALGLASVGGTAMLVAGGILVLGAALYLAWTRSENFRNAVINGWESIKQSALSVYGFLKPYILQAFDAIVSFGQQKLGQLRQFWDENGSQILQAAKNFFTPIAFIIGKTMSAAWAVMKFVWPAVLLLIKSVWGSIKGVINGALNMIMGAVKIFSGLFTGDFGRMWDGIKQLFIGAVQFVWNYMNLLFFGKFLSAGKAFILSFRSIFTTMWSALKSLFGNSVNFVKNIAVGGFNLLRKIIHGIVNGMTSGITNTISNMVMKTRTLFTILRIYGDNIFKALWGAIRGTVINIGISVRNGFTVMKNKATTLAEALKENVKTKFDAIVELAKALPGKIGNGIKTMAKFALGGVKHLSNMLLSGLGKGINGVTGGINWVFEKIGVESRIPEWKPPKYAKGTDFHPGGPAIVGDGGGPELIRTPAGQVGLSPGTSTLVHLPRGTEVLPHRETNALMNAPAYHSGSLGDGVLHGAYNAVKEKASNAWQGAKDVAGSAWEGTKNAVGKAKDLALDVFSYIGNPKGLMTKVWSQFSGFFPKMSGAFGQMGTGAIKLIKDKIVNFVGEKMSGLLDMGDGWTGGMEKDPRSVGRGAGMGGMMRYVEHWYNQVKNRFGPTRFMGGFSDRGVVGNSKVKSMHAYGRAFDIGGSHQTMNAIAEYLRQSASNLQYVIYNRKIAGPGMGKAWRRYNGLNPHTDHVHADFLPGGGGGGGGFGNFKGGGAAMARTAITQALRMLGKPMSLLEPLMWIAQKESGFNPNAVNNWDSNARRGDPSVGLFQIIGSTFKRWMYPGHGNRRNPLHSALAAIRYMDGRYGGVMKHPGVKSRMRGGGYKPYANGGIINHPHMGLVGEAGPEAIIPLSWNKRHHALPLIKRAASKFGASVNDSSNSYTPAESYSSSGGGGRDVTIHYSPTVHITVPGGGEVPASVKAEVEKILEDHYRKLQTLIIDPEGV